MVSVPVDNARILVVEDDREIRESVADYLTMNGHLATAVADGEEMDDALASKRFDLIVLDIMLPGEDGLSIARRVKRNLNTPIIMLTALSEHVDRVVGLEVGADDYVGKPFNPRVLLARIRAVLRRSANRTPAETVETERILVVDDDSEIREQLAIYLGNAGYDVVTVANGRAMARELDYRQFNLLILDIRMPGEDGLATVARLKESKNVPIIMLTAMAEEIDLVVGLEIGADDYVKKPFEPRELLARVRAVIRASREESDLEAKGELYRFGEYTLNAHSLQLTRGRHEDLVPLTSSEYELLLVFLRNPNEVLDRDQILELLSQEERVAYDRSIDVRVTRLRSKIEVDPSKPQYIRTIWGRGYLFCPDVI